MCFFYCHDSFRRVLLYYIRICNIYINTCKMYIYIYTNIYVLHIHRPKVHHPKSTTGAVAQIPRARFCPFGTLFGATLACTTQYGGHGGGSVYHRVLRPTSHRSLGSTKGYPVKCKWSLEHVSHIFNRKIQNHCRNFYCYISDFGGSDRSEVPCMLGKIPRFFVPFTTSTRRLMGTNLYDEMERKNSFIVCQFGVWLTTFTVEHFHVERRSCVYWWRAKSCLSTGEELLCRFFLFTFKVYPPSVSWLLVG